MAINFPTNLDVFAHRVAAETISEDHMNDVQHAIEALEVKVGKDASAVAASHDYIIANFFASGRKVWIYANAAPTGWSIYTTAADCVIAAKGGSNAYNVTGGDGTLYGNFTMTEAQMPVHLHYMGPIAGNLVNTGDLGGAGASGRDTGTAGSGATTYRPLAAVGIVISKT